jgi:hypothetical protein
MQNKLRWLKLAVVAAAALVAYFGFYNLASKNHHARANSSGPPPTFTNAPGESNCTACHGDFPVNSGNGNITVTGLPMRYTPSAQYPITVTVNHENGVVFGFQTTALNAAGQTAGNYTLPTQTPPQMQLVNGVVDVNGTIITRRYVEHTLNGIIPPPMTFNTRSWTFTWQAPAARQGRVRFYASGNGANSDGSTSGDYVYTGTATTCSSATGANFDNDIRADISVFRPSNGTWYRLNSSNGAFVATPFGASGDRLVPGDYDGDGRTDTAVFRNGFWYILNSSNGNLVAYQFGASGDVPVVGDYDGDGRSDLAVFRPSTGIWYTLNLVNNAFNATNWGAPGDKPVGGDYDADGRTDFAVFRPSNGTWYILRSTNGQLFALPFGTSGDRPAPGDYDGDGRTDAAVFRPSNGTWYLQRSTAGFAGVAFGVNGDQPAPADYDGDCQTDIAVFRNGNWYILNSSDGSFRTTLFGAAGDVAVASAYTAE